MEKTFDHPAQKPVVLAEILIRNHLEAGQAVYDPFLDRHDECTVSSTHLRKGRVWSLVSAQATPAQCSGAVAAAREICVASAVGRQPIVRPEADGHELTTLSCNAIAASPWDPLISTAACAH